MTTKAQLTRLMQIRYRNNRQWVKLLGLFREQQEASRLMGRIERCEEEIAEELANLVRLGKIAEESGPRDISAQELTSIDDLETLREMNNGAWMDAIRAAYIANPRKARAVMREIAENDMKIRKLMKGE